MPTPTAVGDHLTLSCPFCQERCDHTVLALNGAQITTVTCTLCGSVTPLSPAGAAPNARGTRAKKSVRVPPSLEPQWRAKLAAAPDQARPYTRTAAYRLNEILLHEQFGLGVVVRLGERKCSVLFQDKERLMASAN
ncbi:MAG: hypothetical protein AB7N91_30945 [Candidatus Tectimicrobiota bacterium]